MENRNSTQVANSKATMKIMTILRNSVLFIFASLAIWIGHGLFTHHASLRARTGNGLDVYFNSSITKPVSISNFLNTEGATYVCVLGSYKHLRPPVPSTIEFEKIIKIINSFDEIEIGWDDFDWQIVSFTDEKVIDYMMIDSSVESIVHSSFKATDRSINGNPSKSCVSASVAKIDKFGEYRLLGLTE